MPEYRNAYLRRMLAARAEIAIPAVTYLHRGAGRGFGRADVSVFDCLREGLARCAIRRMAIFDTRFVIECAAAVHIDETYSVVKLAQQDDGSCARVGTGRARL